jgi:hypothetical protein
MGTGHHRRQHVAADIPHLHIRDEGVEAHHARVNLAQRRGVQLDAQALELTRRRDVLAILPPPAGGVEQNDMADGATAGQLPHRLVRLPGRDEAALRVLALADNRQVQARGIGAHAVELHGQRLLRGMADARIGNGGAGQWRRSVAPTHTQSVEGDG